jgi:Dolichyl-phosphate-mannose-protein mannosyltransferase
MQWYSAPAIGPSGHTESTTLRGTAWRAAVLLFSFPPLEIKSVETVTLQGMEGRVNSGVSRGLGVLRLDSTVMSRRPVVLSWARSHLFLMALGLVGLGVLMLHIVGLTSSPPGFYVDEASIGYNGYAISVDGHDQNGESWPLYFQAFGGQENPIIIYLIAGAMKLLGPSVGVVRAVASLISLTTAIVLGRLVYRLFGSRWVGLATFVVAGTLPWLFIIGRIGFEVSTLPAVLGLFLLVWWKVEHDQEGQRRQLLMAILAGLLLGLAIYAYTTARVLVALLVVALWVSYLGEWKRRWRPLAATSLIALASYIPLVQWSFQHPGSLTARFNAISILCQPVANCYANPGIVGNADDGRFFPLVVAERLIRVYSFSWSPKFLFYSGDPYGRHVTGYGGELYVTLAPFLIVGLIALVRRWREPFWRLIGLGALLGGIPAAMTLEFGHSLRTMAVVPFLIIIIALGATELIRLLSGQRLIAVAWCAAILIEICGFMNDYFTKYPDRQGFWFDRGLERAIAAARDTPHRGPIVLSDHIDQAPIMFAFFSREDPKTYRARGIAGNGAVVKQVGGQQFPSGSVVVAKPDERLPDADLVQTIATVGKDGWGHPGQRDIDYKIWLTR